EESRNLSQHCRIRRSEADKDGVSEWYATQERWIPAPRQPPHAAAKAQRLVGGRLAIAKEILRCHRHMWISEPERHVEPHRVPERIGVGRNVRVHDERIRSNSRRDVKNVLER